MVLNYYKLICIYFLYKIFILLLYSIFYYFNLFFYYIYIVKIYFNEKFRLLCVRIQMLVLQAIFFLFENFNVSFSIAEIQRFKICCLYSKFSTCFISKLCNLLSKYLDENIACCIFLFSTKLMIHHYFSNLFFVDAFYFCCA